MNSLKLKLSHQFQIMITNEWVLKMIMCYYLYMHMWNSLDEFNFVSIFAIQVTWAQKFFTALRL